MPTPQRFDLMSLKHSYFKGSKELFLQPNGQDMNVYGDNGTRKTTIFDSVSYILFDKDSDNKSPKAFGIKTLDENGDPIPDIQHEVEAVFQYGVKLITLKKVYKEKWGDKRKSGVSEKSGNETDYFVDGVPVLKKEYQEEVAKIISEERFKLLTNPRYFSETMKWQDRRKLLVEVCGDVTDEYIISMNPKIASLPSILNGRSIEKHLVVLTARRTEIKDQGKQFKSRFDEVFRGIPDTNGLNEGEIASQIATQRSLVSNKESEINRIQSGSEITVKQNRIREIDGELLEIKNKVEAESYKAVSDQRIIVDGIKRDADFINADIRKYESSIKNNEVTIFRKDAEKTQLGERWDRVNAETFSLFEHQSVDSCPACQQSLPSDQVQAAHDKAKADHDRKLAEFNQGKSKRLEDINVQGKALKDEITLLEAENVSSNKAIESLNNQLIAARENLHVAETKLTELQGNIQRADADPLYLAKQAEKAEVETEITTLRNSTHESVQKVQEEIQAIRGTIISLEQEQAKFDQVRKANTRVEELKLEEKNLGVEAEKIDHELWMIEEFTRQKVSMLESKINSHFKITKFKLFENQENGGLNELCDATNLKGVPYSSGLNKAGRANCGLDIINTFAEYFELAPVVFIDDAEGVTKPIATHGQLIRLIVSEADQKLRAEMVQQKVMEAF